MLGSFRKNGNHSKSELRAGRTHLFVLREVSGIHLRKTFHRASVMSGETKMTAKNDNLAAAEDKPISKSKGARQLPQIWNAPDRRRYGRGCWLQSVKRRQGISQEKQSESP